MRLSNCAPNDVRYALRLLGLLSIAAVPAGAQSFMQGRRGALPLPLTVTAASVQDSNSNVTWAISDRAITMLTQNPDGTFFPVTQLEAANPGFYDIATVRGGGFVTTWITTALGTFLAWQNILLRPGSTLGPGIGQRGLIPVDLQGQGRDDVIAVTAAGYIEVWRPQSGFAPRYLDSASQVFGGSGPVGAFEGAGGDFDGDGDLDVILTFPNSTPGMRLYENIAGSLTERTPAFFLTLATGSEPRIQSLDVDGDGDADLLHEETLEILVSDGVGTFRRGAALASLLPGANAPLVLDADGDGDPDIVVSDRSGLSVFANDGAGNYSAQRGVWNGSLRIAQPLDAHDLDGDGDLDLLVRVGGQLVLLGNDGQGRFDAWSEAGPNGSWYGGRAVLGDLDGDGTPDAMSQDRTAWNDGTGRLLAITQLTGYGDQTPVLVDMEGDGDLDGVNFQTVSAPACCARLVIHENDGHGRFASASSTVFPSLGSTTGVISVGDLDADGRADLLFAGRVFLGSSGSPPYQYAFPGTLPLQFPPTISPSALLERAWILDFQQDGVNDVLHSRGEYFMADAGAWNMASLLPSRMGYLSRPYLLPGDADGDGDLDLFVSGPSPQVWINDGMGNFSEPGDRLPLGLVETSSATWVLADDDSDLDLVVLTRGGMVLLRNDGAGYFTQELFCSGCVVPFMGDELVALDVDADGDQDVVAFGSEVVYLNITRQLHAPRLPRIGHDYLLEYYAAPTPGISRQVLTAVVAGGLQPRIPIAPYGTFALGPGLSSLPVVQLPANGSIGRSIPIPNATSLLGMAFSIQALFGVPGAHFSNAVFDVILP